MVRQFFRRRSVREFAVSLAHSWDRAQAQASRTPICHNSLRLSHSDYPVLAVRNVTFASLILDGNIKWSTPFGMWKCDSPGFDTAVSRHFFLKIWLLVWRRKFSWLHFQSILMLSFENAKRYSTLQFFKLVTFSVYPSSTDINWKSNQENVRKELWLVRACDACA